MLKYRCCECNSVFPSKDALNGCSDGFKYRFYCPSCKVRLKAPFLSGGKHSLTYESDRHEKWCNRSALVSAAAAILVILLSPKHWMAFVLAVTLISCFSAYGYYRLGFVPYANIRNTQKAKE